MSTVTIAAEEFRRALHQVLPAASTDPKGGVLRGVLVEASEGSLRLVATDKHRLVVCDLPVVEGTDANFSAVLDATALADLRDEAAGAAVVLSVEGRRASASVGGHSVKVAVLAGDFPDHRALLNQVTGGAADVRLIADQRAVVDALEEVPDDEPLRVQLRADALEFGQLVPIVVGATYNGPPASLFVEPIYLHDAVVAAPGPVLAIEAVDETSPIVLSTPGDNSYLALVMPVRVGTPRSRKR